VKTQEEKNAYNRGWCARNRDRRSAARRRSYETILGRGKKLLRGAKERADKAQTAYSLTEAWIQERLEVGVCEATGLPIDMNARGTMSAFSPTIDRIVPELGYVPANCRLTIAAFNTGKNRWSDDVLAVWARAFLKQYDSAH
jgi:hypothetical protein